MNFSQIFKHLEKKIRESNEYKIEEDRFIINSLDSNTLALDYITTQCKKQKLFNIENLDCCDHTEEAINHFIVEQKQHFEQEDAFHSDFVKYLDKYKPKTLDSLKRMAADHAINNFGNRTIPDDISTDEKLYLVRFFMDFFIKTLKPRDIFDILTSDNSEKAMIDLLTEYNSKLNLEKFAYIKKINELQSKHESQIINKKNLILLLDFCNKFLKNNPKANAENIIKAFEDEKRYCGAWKTWSPFFNKYSDFIKEITSVKFDKKIDSIFAINNRRDQIDNLFSTIETYKKL